MVMQSIASLSLQEQQKIPNPQVIEKEMEIEEKKENNQEMTIGL